jgi:Zn-dependent metalloprotease
MMCGCAVVPPQIFLHLASTGNPQQQRFALLNLSIAAELRGERKTFSNFSTLMAVTPGVKRRTIYDAENKMLLPGRMARSEGEKATGDVSVNEAYDGTGRVYDFWLEGFGRNSIDAQGMRIDSSVHYRRLFSNAFWNGQQMVFGDGDGEIFGRFTRSIDIIAHEMMHGVTQFEAGLRYTGESGALNESISDVFGVLAAQFLHQQTVEEASWIVGAGLFHESINALGIRSLKAPGTAYNDPLIGKDEQPAHMEDYVHTTEDNGGVHINSGIPNKAFYNLAMAMGGQAWTVAGKIWYLTLMEKVKPGTDFRAFARMTNDVASNLFGKRSKEQQQVEQAWVDVGIQIE